MCMTTNETPKKQSRAGFWIAIVLLSILLLFSMAANFILAAGLAMLGGEVDSGLHARDEFPRVTEKWSFGSGETKAARIAVRGVITRRRTRGFLSFAEHDPVESMLRQIRTASNDERVRTIILEIDSPGGEITAVDEIHNALLDFKKSRADRNVVGFVRGLAASGGYYLAAASDWIIAEPTAIVGSISAIIQTLNWKELSDKIGVHDVTIKTGDNKDMLNPFHEVDPAQVALLQEVLDSMHDHFFNIVMNAREIERDALKELADGRIFNISQAIEYDLVDQTGYWNDVMAKTAELAGEDSVKIVRYEERPGVLRMFSQMSLPDGPHSWIDIQRPRFMYLWTP